MAGSTQYAQVSSLHSLASDGFSAGALARIVIDSQGIISGIYSNGVSRVVGDLVLANFNNVDDLDRIGDTLLLPTIESGAARTGAPGQNEFGTVASGSLELSTVDLATEFVALLMAQRSFQVNSRVITTADRMYEVARILSSKVK